MSIDKAIETMKTRIKDRHIYIKDLAKWLLEDKNALKQLEKAKLEQEEHKELKDSLSKALNGSIFINSKYRSCIENEKER
jgi:O-acetylhomoserine/O-acetylserine sulfhydrylase-like pyridoxal-dependent enzyme